MRSSHTIKGSLPFVFGVALSIALVSQSHSAQAQQATLSQLEAKLEQQYAAIQDVFLNSPGKITEPRDIRQRVSKWQDNLAQSFVAAGKTIDEILELYPPDREKWIERKETMWLYSQPVSPPSSRMVFGASEVETRAQLIDPPPAEYTDAARQANASGEVRLRLVLASDGTVKYIFPMKPLKYGLTESAMAAARQIKFERAIRDGEPASQFETLSYVFRDGHGLPPNFPRYEFSF